MLKKIQKYGRSLCAVLMAIGTCFTLCTPAAAGGGTWVSIFSDNQGRDLNGTFDKLSTEPGILWWSWTSTTTGINYVERPMTIEPRPQLYVGLKDAYVPYDQSYKLRMHICSATGKGLCTISASTRYLDSNSVRFTSTIPIYDQVADFEFNKEIINGGSSLCYTLVGADGREYHSAGMTTCQDAYNLPDHPMMCSATGDINVDFGSLERSDIATNYKEGTSEKRAVQVICSGNKSATYEITFAYSPVTVAGIESLQTTSTGLSVVMLLDDQPVGPSSAPVTKSFQSGTSIIMLGFVAVRDPNVNVANVPTGNFTASATIIMTEQ